MRVMVVTQEDSLVIPSNIERIMALDGIEVVLVATLNVKGALKNRKSYFLRGFGLWQSLRMACHLLSAKASDFLDSLFRYRLWTRKFSVKGCAIGHSIPFVEASSPNTEEFLNPVRQAAPDLIVSFSAPCVFRPELLRLPPLGCVNLHCSRLPEYAGLLPSFWVLFNGESTAGATVHYMDSEIDNGQILAQVEVPVRPGASMLDLIRETKRRGGELMEQVILSLSNGTARPMPNDRTRGSYFSWPTVEQMIAFRRQGGRLV